MSPQPLGRSEEGSFPAAPRRRTTSEQQPGRKAPGAASLEASLPKEAPGTCGKWTCQVVPPTVICQLPLALYRSSVELNPLDHNHVFPMYTPLLTRVCGALPQEATAVPGLPLRSCSLCPTICLSGQWDSCVLFLSWCLPWGPSEPYRGRPKTESLVSLPGESLPGEQAPEFGRGPFSNVFRNHLGQDGPSILWLAELRGIPFHPQPRAFTHPTSSFALPSWGPFYSSRTKARHTARLA